jgi:hypothetical protein
MPNERTVAFGVVDETRVGEHIQRQQAHDGGKISLSSIADAVPKFTPLSYPTFLAEYAVQSGQDIVVHFFLPQGFLGAQDYWTSRFPTALDATAREYFAAERPRLQAKFTQELNSWWFKARGYGHIIDLVGFVRKFFETLDASLRARAQA